MNNAILEHVESSLTAALITNIAADDPALAGLVKIGPLQGDPSPEEARIAVTLFENDPDRITNSGVTGMRDDFADYMEMNEIGGAVTMARRFTVKGRCLFAKTREGEDDARRIASTVRRRIEKCLLNTSFNGVTVDGEYVARGVISTDLSGEMMQAGGPPDAFDYLIKVHFSVLTTQTGIQT